MDILKATNVAAPLDRARLSAEDVADAIAAIAATYRRPDSGRCMRGRRLRRQGDRAARRSRSLRRYRHHRRTRRYERATHGLRPSRARPARGLRDLRSPALVRGPQRRRARARGRREPVLRRRPAGDRRRQAAPGTGPGTYEPVGLGVARYLLVAKVAGQARLVLQALRRHRGRSATIAELAEAIEGAETVEEARQLEASAAALYFAAWADRPETRPRSPPRTGPGAGALVHLRGPAVRARQLQRQPQGRAAGERPAQLRLRPARSRGHLGLRRRRARPWPGDRPQRPQGQAVAWP